MNPSLRRAALRVVLACAAVLAGGAPAAAQFSVEYPPVQGTDAVSIREWLMENDQLGRMARGLNEWIRMPRPVRIRMAECTSSDIRWNAEQRAVELCDRMVVRLYAVTEGQDSARQAVSGTLRYLTLHGVAHAIMDELDLPAGADPEATIDELSALLLMAGGPRSSVSMLNGITTLQRVDEGWGQWNYATAHQLGPERFQNVACLVYGVNPDRFAAVRQAGLVPARTQSRCRTAGTRILDVWGRRLSRYLHPS